MHVDGLIDCRKIAQNFADHFSKICSPFNEKRNLELKQQYENMRSMYTGSLTSSDHDEFDVQLISEQICYLKNGKAPGLDDISAEHLKHCHPVLVIILCKLFNVYMSCGHVPRCFCDSYTIPIPKVDKYLCNLTVNDFRGISISPVISKLFELCILDRYGHYLYTSDCQFGFKRSLSCKHVIYSVRQTINHYTYNGSTVNLCFLDLSKAFDRMNHFALFIKLMNRAIPLTLLAVLEYWFKSSSTCVRWCGHNSAVFRLSAGVRQGGVLSPILFSVYIDDIVHKVVRNNVGCYFSYVCTSIFLYADDILLLSPTLSGLQRILSTCEEELNSVDMHINTSKSVCMRIGPRFDLACSTLSVSGVPLKWVSSYKYLGVNIVSSTNFKCSFLQAKRKFFAAFNAVFGKIGRNASEDVIIQLLQSKCMPIILYGTEVCGLLKRDKQSINFSVTRIFMKIFKTSSVDVVRYCQYFFHFLPVEYLLEIRESKFLFSFCKSDNRLCMLFFSQAERRLQELYSTYSVSSMGQLRKAVELKFNEYFS